MSDCARVVERLIDGAGGKELAADPEVALHLGSCLDCFRTLTELRDVPRVAELLRREAAHANLDPGPAFWDVLATRIVEKAVAGEPAARAATARPRAARPGRRPFPAGRGPAIAGALGGLAAAALVLVLASRTAAPPPVATPHEGSGAPAPVEVAADDLAGDADLAAGDDPADVTALDGPGLERLLESLRTSEPAELRGLIDASGDGNGNGNGRIADEIAGLDAPALRRLAQRLAGSTL